MKKLIYILMAAAIFWCNGKALFIWTPTLCTIEENTGIGDEPETFEFYFVEENDGFGWEE